MKAAICTAAALIVIGPLAKAESFEILSPPGSTGNDTATVIQNGVVGGSYSEDVNSKPFTFSREDGYTTFNIPEQRFFDAPHLSGIDGTGRVVGSFLDSNREDLSFVREPNGDIVTFAFPEPDVQFTEINSVNVRGTSVGSYSVLDENVGNLRTQGFMRVSTGQIVQVRYPNSSITVVTSNNDNGEMVGYTGFNGQRPDMPFFRGALGPWKIFSLPPGCAAPDDFFGGNIYLNNSGTAAGDCEVAPDTRHGFIRMKSGEIKSFKVPGSISTRVSGIAANGNVAGTYTDATGSHAYIRRSIATYFTFDAPTAAPGTTTVTGYSADGDLVGNFKDAEGNRHAFVRYKN